MAEEYPTRSLPDQTTASGDRNESICDQNGQVVDQSKSTGDQHGQIADHTNPDPVQMLIKDQVSALQYAQRTGATTVNFIETQYNASGGQTIQNISYPGQTEPSTSDMPTKRAATFNLHECQEELRAYYLEQTGKVNLLPWIPEESKEMESIFVDIELERTGEPKASKNMKSNEDLVTLKTNQGLRVNRVLVTGDAGSGKSTTAANLAYKWAKNDIQSPLFKFTLVFLIRMKDIEDSTSSLVDLIFQNVLPEDSNVSKEDLGMYIKENAKDILFVVDGMDEDSSGALKNKSSGITKLLHSRKLRKSCVILTTRPRNISDLGMYASNYTELKLDGFSLKNIHAYMVKFFRDDLEKVELLFGKLKAEPHILALASIPVLLLMVCMLWENQRTTPKTKTQLYQKTIRHLWYRYKSRRSGDLTQDEYLGDKEFDKELNDLLNQLGEVALNNTHLDGNKFLFTMTELGRNVCELGCKVGILKREQTREGLERNASVTFLHSTFQYFCAAFHLAYLLGAKQKKLDDFDGILFSFSEDEFIYSSYVLEFCCGIQPELTSAFLQTYTERTSQITSKIKQYFQVFESIHLKLIFEGQLSYEQCSNLIPLFPGQETGLVLTDDLIPSVLYMLELYKSSGTRRGFLSTIKSLEVTTGCTPWLSTLLEHSNNIHECRIFLRVSEIVSDLEKMYKALSELPNIKKLAVYNLSIHTPLYHRMDATNLLNFLIKKRIKLTLFRLFGLLFDEKAMVKYVSRTGTSIVSLGLLGSPDAGGKVATINNVIDVLPRLEHLKHLEVFKFPIHSAIKHFRPIISQLNEIVLSECGLHEKHLKELCSFLSRAQKLKYVDLSKNVLSVASVQALVESLKKIPFLEELILADTGLNDESACILARFVRGKPSINFLCLDHNPGIGRAGRDALRGLPLKRLVENQFGGEFKDTDTL